MHLTRYLLSDIALLVAALSSLRLARRLGHGLSAVLFWLVLALAFPIPPNRNSTEPLSEVELVHDITPDALPQERPVEFSARVLSRLEQAEKVESNPHLRDDVRIAWITTLFAFREESEPFVQASYRVLGLHPDKVWPAIEAKRHAKLGADYPNFYAANRGASSPKKPVQSERRLRGNDGRKKA
jgi:hypothetical protein